MRSAIAWWIGILPALGVAFSAAAATPAVTAGFQYGYAQIEFDQPMQTWPNERRDDVVALQPELPMQCSWDSDTRLRCQFKGGVRPAPATRYRLQIAAGLKTQAGDAMPARTLHIETARPTVSASIEGWKDGAPRIVVNSDAKTTGRAMAAVLRLRIDGKPVALPPLRLLPARGRWDNAPRYGLPLPAIEGRDRRLVLAVVPGLKSGAGPLPGMQDAVLLTAQINESFALRGIACAGRDETVRAFPENGKVEATCQPGEAVQLVFPQPLDAASRSRVEQSLPPGVRLRGWKTDENSWRYRGMAAEAVVTSPPQWAELEIEAARAEATILLGGDLRAEGANASLEPVQVRLRTGDYRPRIRAKHASSLIADGRQPPVLAEALNAGASGFSVLGIGARVRSDTVRTQERRDNTPRPILSPLTARTLAQGGWVRWTPLAETSSGQRPARSINPLQFAAPGFDLYAVAGRREVLAWANAWQGDAAVAGAEVELLWLDGANAQPRVVARTATDADGVAMLRLPDDFIVPETKEDDGSGSMWLLRAADGGRRAASRTVLPVGEVSTWGMGLGRANARMMWGVSDRPLYRAGDTVRYRLWQRDRNGTRLLPVRDAGPLSLRLSNQNESKTILEWRATPRADGSIAGELALPIHLTDATYCVGVEEQYEVKGACFFVGTYRAQDLWAQAQTADRILRDGDRFVLDVSAGYYSGGPAAGVDIADLQSSLQGLPLDEAYPQYADYDFVDVTGDDVEDGVSLQPAADGAKPLDAEGKARLDLRAAFDVKAEEASRLPAFARLYLAAEVKPEDREGTTTNDAETRYTRFEQFVGLRITPRWLDATTPVRAQGVVIDAEGKLIPDAEIRVEIDYLPWFGDDKAQPQRLAQCTLRVDAEAPCDFPRVKSGRYRLTARSGSAAPAEVVRYVWVGGAGVQAAVEETSLELLETPLRDGSPLRVVLKQPNAAARALFVFTAGDRLLSHRVERVAGNVQSYVLPVDAAWRGTLSLRAYVRDAAPASVAGGYRAPVAMSSESIVLPASKAVDAPAPVSVAFEAASATPGATVAVRLRNDSAQPRDVVLAVMDDALRALAARWLPYSDPLGADWLERVLRGNDGRVTGVGFDDWNGNEWTRWLPWPDAVTAKPRDATGEDCSLLALAEAAACEARRAADAAQAAADAAAGNGEPPVVFDDPGRIDAAQTPPALLLLAPPAPAMPDYAGESTSLDRIEVTGSRIKRADLEDNRSAVPQPGLRPRDDGASRNLRALARIRTQFADTALWQPDIRLAPGESRRIEFKLPDNLTRWRAVAWSNDAGDDFAMAQAALETGLPVEVRLQTPVRIYPGDRARLAANVRQTGDSPVDARTELQAAGIGAPLQMTQVLSLAARGQDSVAMEIAPRDPGALLVTAAAETPAGRDAVATPVEVASPLIDARKVQAGWLGDTPLALDLPTLPAGASNPQLQLSLLRGGTGLIERWTTDLRDYPHRCWEQILSRGVAAALALERGDASWPDARAVVQEALDNAAVFQGDGGGFVYFAEASDRDTGGPSPQAYVPLTAYTVRAFVLLRSLGYAINEKIDADAREYLARAVPEARQAGGQRPANDAYDDALARAAFAAAARDDVPGTQLDALWTGWDQLALPARIAATRALARQKHAAAGEAMTRLLASAPARGPARVLLLPQRYDLWMSSDLREQCALIELLRDYPDLGERTARRALIAGLTDLYAGGIGSVDTQTGAICLVALRDLANVAKTDTISARFSVGAAGIELRLAPGDTRADGRIDAPAAATQLRVEPGQGELPASYIAELRYQEDARQARASAVGLSIARRHDVLRNGTWMAVAGQDLREGDWVRITLTIDSSAPRYFVAVTDAVPGGLRPTDLALSGVAGLDLQKVSDQGSPVFATRRLDPRNPRFYAEYLPAGRHELRYFARAGNGGDYLAAPAVVELMYGNATSARTAAARINIAANND